MANKIILVLNCGSSSVKYSLFRDLTLLESGLEERIGLHDGCKNHQQAIKKIFDDLCRHGHIASLLEIDALGHRVVHGGTQYSQPVLLTPAVIRDIEKYSKLAPLHNPPNLLGIKICRQLLPKIKNFAVFDTEYYANMPEEAIVYALPYHLYSQKGIRRYGFHGISHQYVSQEAEKILGHKIDRLITCHLGAGSSITATYQGHPIDTSMGFTPLEGLVMGTRCGSIDPAIPLYLIKELHYSPQRVDHLLNNLSGYLGICDLKDLREILASLDQKLPHLAYNLYLRSVVKHIGSYVGLMDGLDALVFTAGVGEGSAKFRSDVVDHFSFLHAQLDKAKNSRHETIISSLKSKVRILVIPTNEALMIARAVINLLN
jgi:acetate kinase